MHATQPMVQAGGKVLEVPSVEITYGLERILMSLQASLLHVTRCTVCRQPSRWWRRVLVLVLTCRVCRV